MNESNQPRGGTMPTLEDVLKKIQRQFESFKGGPVLILVAGNQGFRTVLKWSVVTFVSSTLPYLYAAWAGRQSHSKQVWFILIIILIVILVCQLQKLWRTKLSG